MCDERWMRTSSLSAERGGVRVTRRTAEEVPPEGLEQPQDSKQKSRDQNRDGAESGADPADAVRTWLKACPVHLSADQQRAMAAKLLTVLRDRSR
jgi:hypothetical protein